MSEKHTFHVMREMTGDKAYAEGDQRALSAVDAAHLVRSGALKPMGEKATAAMAELLGNEPAKQSEVIVQTTAKDDAPNNKAMGNAPANKGGGGGRKGASGGKAAAARAGTAPAAPPAAPAAPAVPNVGQDGGAPATPPPADQGSGEGAGDPPAGEGTGTGDSGPPVAAATTPPPATPGKRR